MVGVFGQFDGFPLKLSAADLHGKREVADLHARVVVVELAFDPVTLRSEDIGEHVAERALARVTEVQGPRRVG